MKALYYSITCLNLQETEEGRSALLLKVMISKIFDEGLLIDIHRCPFYPSSLPPASRLIFIIEGRWYSSLQTEGNLIEKGKKQLESYSREWPIIYAGRYFSALPSEVRDRIMAYSPSLFLDEVSATFPKIYGTYPSVFRSRVNLEVKGIKCPSVWEDISYILNEAAFLLRAPSVSNVEILRAMLQTDFLLKKNRQVFFYYLVS